MTTNSLATDVDRAIRSPPSREEHAAARNAQSRSRKGRERESSPMGSLQPTVGREGSRSGVLECAFCATLQHAPASSRTARRVVPVGTTTAGAYTPFGVESL